MLRFYCRRVFDGLSCYLPDRLGSIRDISNDTGNLINSTVLSAYGDVVNETSPSAADRFKFTGREYDAETGLYYYRARYYDPKLGRFISEDPLGFDAGDVNLYRYVGNGPGNARDPGGAFALPAFNFRSTAPLISQVSTKPQLILLQGGRSAANLVVKSQTKKALFFASKGIINGFLSVVAIMGLKGDNAAPQMSFDWNRQGNKLIIRKTFAIDAGNADAEASEECECDFNHLDKPSAEDPQYNSRVVDELFQSTDTLPGGTAGAALFERCGGARVGGKDHVSKAAERARQIRKILATENLSTADRKLLEDLLEDLECE